MTLKEDHVALAVGVLAPEEMVEAHFVQGGHRGKGRDVSAYPFVRLVGSNHHRGRVPTNQTLDAALDVRTAGHQHLVVGGNRIDVGVLAVNGSLTPFSVA